MNTFALFLTTSIMFKYVVLSTCMLTHHDSLNYALYDLLTILYLCICMSMMNYLCIWMKAYSSVPFVPIASLYAFIAC